MPGMSVSGGNGFGARLPVLGALDPVGRIAVLTTIGVGLAAIVLEVVVHADKTLIFVVAAVAILGLAWVVGQATERLGTLTSPQVGGILNATFGNIAELIIAFFALQRGFTDVVKASLTGSIIGNLLLVLGVSVLLGGIRHGTQTFSQRVAGTNAALLVVALTGLLVPAVFSFTSAPGEGSRTEESVLVAIVLIIGYGCSLLYQFTNPRRPSDVEALAAAEPGPGWSIRIALGVLIAAAVSVAVLSDILVDSITDFIATFGLSTFFVGIVLIPVIGNLSENLVAVQLAIKDRMEFTMAVTYGSSLQVALFVAPVLVILGAVTGHAMDLVFNPLEVVAVAAAVGISALIALDGESNWLEGALLIIVYLILAFSFFEFVPR
jgi:Ca2+:H+ antiporter